MSQAVHDTVSPDAGICDGARELAEVIEEARYPDIGSARGIDARDHRLPPRELPGFRPPYDGSDGKTPCGDPVPHFCADCGQPSTVGSTCTRSVCERCAPAWARDRTIGICERLDAAARLMSDQRDVPVYKHHVVVSPDPSWFSESTDSLDETFGVVQELLRRMGAEGIVAYHPFSGAEDGVDDIGEWQDRLFEGRDWRGDVRDELQLRPHFHAVVVAPHIPGGQVTRDLERETGWVVNRITKRDGSARSLEDLHDVARAVSYTLSHTGIHVREDANNNAEYRHFGSTFDSDSLEVYPDTERSVAEAVREVVPHTLGIQAGEVRCDRTVDASEIRTDWSRAYAAAGGDAGDAGGEGDPPSPEDSSDMPGEPETRTVGGEGGAWTTDCMGRLRHVRHAEEFLADDDWRDDAEHATALEALHAAWDLGEWDPDEWGPPD